MTTKTKGWQIPPLPKVEVPEGMRFMGWMCQTATKGSNVQYHYGPWRRNEIYPQPGLKMGGDWCPDCFPVFAGKPNG